MTATEQPAHLPGNSLKVDAALVDPTHETDLPTGQAVAHHPFGPGGVDTFPGQQRPHDISALGPCLVLPSVEFRDVLRGYQTGDPVDIAKPVPLQLGERPQRDSGILDPVGDRVRKLLGEVLVTQPIEPQHHIHAVPA